MGTDKSTTSAHLTKPRVMAVMGFGHKESFDGLISLVEQRKP
jgi:hypothetical protein